MRVKLDNRIYFCTLATHTPDEALILLTIKDYVYVVDMKTTQNAKDCHEQLLELGYYDFTGYYYSN